MKQGILASEIQPLHSYSQNFNTQLLRDFPLHNNTPVQNPFPTHQIAQRLQREGKD